MKTIIDAIGRIEDFLRDNNIEPSGLRVVLSMPNKIEEARLQAAIRQELSQHFSGRLDKNVRHMQVRSIQVSTAARNE